MSTLCSSCGQRNRDKALRCSRCGAPLGAEPTASTTFGAPENGVPDWRADVDDVRDGARPRERRGADGAGTAWLPWTIAGVAVAVALGVAGYAVLNRPASAPEAGTAAPEAALAPPEASAPPPGPAPAPAPAASAPPASAVPPAAPAQPVAETPPREERRAAAAPPRRAPPRADAPPPRVRGTFPEPPPEARNAAPWRTPAREPMPVPAAPMLGEAGAPPSGPWINPPREAANTSAPGYRDAGPPVVAGPGPRVPGPVPAMPDGAGMPAAAPRDDRGPPATPGPGPRYDFGSPGAAPR